MQFEMVLNMKKHNFTDLFTEHEFWEWVGLFYFYYYLCHIIFSIFSSAGEGQEGNRVK